MQSPRYERLKDFGGLRERVRRQPDNFGAFLVERHAFPMELYEAAASTDGNAECFAKAIADLCASRGSPRWEDFASDDHQRQYFKDFRDPFAQRIIVFWPELDDPLKF